MFGGTFNFLIEWVIICLIGIIIKLMDDYLDQDLDSIEGKYTLPMILGKATLPYTLLGIVVCMAIKPALSGTLFLASYLVGMGHNLEEPLPFGWSPLQESIIFGIFGILFFGIFEMLSSLTIIIFIQLLDDFLDYYTDAQFSRRNFFIRFGFWESLIFGLIIFGMALILDIRKAILVTISLPIVLNAIKYGKKLVSNHD